MSKTPLAPNELEELRRLLFQATPRPWVFDLVEPQELTNSRGEASWVPSDAHHTVVGWSLADRALVRAALRVLPQLLTELENV